MDEKCTMQNLLLTTKGACDLYLHGTIESSTGEVHQVFDSALNQCLNMQESIYQEMMQKGWYQQQQVEKEKLVKVKNQFSGIS
ncbi:MAG: spore coat protein [Lachnospiraceae bacterium]|nr:spore coat protein [Lachnospiraceae bacterium]